MIEPIIQKKLKRQPQDGITPYMLISTCSSVHQHRFMKAVSLPTASGRKMKKKESQT
jgi:hypothetical protein